MTFAEVQAQIDDGLPVCIYIEWSGGGIGHFILISGYQVLGGIRFCTCTIRFSGAAPNPIAVLSRTTIWTTVPGNSRIG